MKREHFSYRSRQISGCVCGLSLMKGDSAAHSIRENARLVRTGRGWGSTALFGLFFCSLLSVPLGGCGAPAAPQPPTLNLPQPVRDLAAARAGNTVHLTFSVPQKTTDRLPVRGLMTARLCRSVEKGPCQPAGSVGLTAQQKTAALDDTLPSELTQGGPKLITYRLAVLNSAGKSASDSAPAYAVAGAAPAAVAAFAITPRRDGIVLSWQPAAAATTEGWVRFDRVQTAGPNGPAQQGNAESGILGGGNASQQEPVEQSLRVPETAAQHRAVALDTTAHSGNSYRYTAQRIAEVNLAGHTLKVASVPSAPANVAYRDTFPPSVPSGLVSAADTPGKAIDLSWTPDSDPGLAGYVVYRRTVGGSGTPKRISPADKPVSAPAWRDTAIVAGQRYAYSVSAADASGNESRRSPEIEDGLPVATPQP